MKQFVENTCEILCEDTGRKVVGELLFFKQHQNVVVSIDRQLKLDLKWNGSFYETKSVGLQFTTDGPLVKNFKG